VALGVFQEAKEIFSGLLEGSFVWVGHLVSMPRLETWSGNSGRWPGNLIH